MFADGENGQPLNGGRFKALAMLRGATLTCLDISIQTIDEAPWHTDAVIVEFRDYTTLRRAEALLPQLLRNYPNGPVFATGPYAEFNADALRAKYGAVVTPGDPPEVLDAVLGTTLGTRGCELAWTEIVPDRSDFRAIVDYPKLIIPRATTADVYDSSCWVKKVSGNIELSYGCLHRCKYCSVYAKFNGAQTEYPISAILADVDQLVAARAEHLVVTDADAFGRPSHALAVLRAVHAKYPDLTCDAVTRVDHIRKIRKHLPELRALGLVKLTSSFEFPDDRVLKAIDKGFVVADISDAVRWCRDANVALAPTFIPFNPWVGVREIEQLPAFIRHHGLEATTDGSQLATRLLLYRGSPLIGAPALTDLNLTLEEKEFHYEWRHPDLRVEDLYRTALAKHGAGGKCCIRC
jgi:hypothetical protein